jgi:hypothetical protein
VCQRRSGRLRNTGKVFVYCFGSSTRFHLTEST